MHLHAAVARLPKIWHKHRLVACCLVSLKWPLLAVVLPRLVQLAFTICQPLVLNRVLVFLADEPESANIGYGLVAAYGIVYVGIAVSQALYWQANARFVTMLRGTLVSAIFSKATEVSITATDNKAAVTLMSTNVRCMHPCIQMIGILTGTGRRYWPRFKRNQRILGQPDPNWHRHLAAEQANRLRGRWARHCVAVDAHRDHFLVTLGEEVSHGVVEEDTGARWYVKQPNNASYFADQIGITSAMLGHIKSIKMSGLTHKLSATIAELRLQEIKASRPFRVFGAVTSAVAQIPLLISPPVAFAMYQGVVAHTGEHFDATRLFSALSFIILLSQPLFFMFDVVLDLSAAFGAFETIQKFLLEEIRHDYRESTVTGVQQGGDQVELQNLPAHRGDNLALEVRDGCFAWSDKPILEHVVFGVNKGQFAMIVGPVASGKTTLLKGLLGEVPHVEGAVWLSSHRVSWCDQSPWILVRNTAFPSWTALMGQNQSIRQNIIGYSNVNEELYRKVIKACDLTQDLNQLPNGDMTVVGSKGLALSGGQKQRVVCLFLSFLTIITNKPGARASRVFSAKNRLIRRLLQRSRQPDGQTHFQKSVCARWTSETVPDDHCLGHAIRYYSLTQPILALIRCSWVSAVCRLDPLARPRRPHLTERDVSRSPQRHGIRTESSRCRIRLQAQRHSRR